MEESGHTTLHEAAINGDEKALNILLSNGADRNAKDHKHGNIPLHEAAWRGYSRCVKALCALPNPKNNKGIKESKIKGVIQETRGALHSALLGTRNAGGFSALHLAAQNGHNQSCREILLAGADPDVQNNYGDTPLHTACRYGHAGATRILLSAKCDPNRKNLNGDSSLHIACAMGRRKLTKILLESGCNQEIQNAQNETPKDIAIRKNLVEIVEILNTPPEIRTTRDRSNSNSKHAEQTDLMGAKKKTKEGIPTTKVNWSPYGCHYFPDPRCFPTPKLETLPKEPLKKGEQYFLDLAGNIRKGPIGVGNTCYCGPFFRHIEDRLSRNQKSIKKYVNKAAEKLDNKVQALALRTDDQIEQLTKSMLADQARGEGRALHLQQWLQRGLAGRLTVCTYSKSRKNLENVNTLTKCRSLELLDEDSLLGRKMLNSRSFDLLKEPEIILHKNADGTCSVQSSACRASGNSNKSRGTDVQQMRGLGYALSKRLEELLTRTNQILEMEKMLRKKRKDASTKNIKDRLKVSPKIHSLYTNDVIEQIGRLSVGGGQCSSLSKERGHYITEEVERFTSSLESKPPPESISATKSSLQSFSPEIAKECDNKKELQRRKEIEQEQSSIISGSSHPNRSSVGSGYGTDPAATEYSLYSQSVSPQNHQKVIEAHEENSEQKFKDLITALRKDYNSVRNAIENEFIKEAIKHDHSSNTPHYSNIEQFDSSFNEGDQSPDPPVEHQIFNGFYQNTNFDNVPSSSSNTINSEKLHPITIELFESDAKKLPKMANNTEIRQPKNRILNGSNWRSEVLKQQSQQLDRKPGQFSAHNSPIKKVEESSIELKALKSPTLIIDKKKVQTLVAKIQGDYSKPNTTGNMSESSEDDREAIQVNPTSNENLYYYNRPQPQVFYQSGPQFNLPSNQVKIQAQIFDTRWLVPKDAYFHDLPNKNRSKPVTDKVPDKEMLQLTETFQMARTRNPIPYSSDYDIEISTPIIEHPQFYPPREKLLSNRKFSFISTAHNQFGVMNINPQLQQPLRVQMPQLMHISTEQAQLERDTNNDSGYSTKIGGSSPGPSPSLSGQTDFSGMGSNKGSNSFAHPNIHQYHHSEDPTNSNHAYYISNVGASSLV